MEKRTRFETVLSGAVADRPPVAMWRHFTQYEHSGAKILAEKLLEFQRQYDWDFVKINPRAVYYHEAFGNEYDYSRYNDVVPTCIKKQVNCDADLAKIVQVSGTAGVFAEQIELSKIMMDSVGKDTPVFHTAFTPIGILLNLCGMRSLGRYREAPRQESPLIEMISRNGDLVHQALEAIAKSMAEYCSALVTQAGIDGVFFAALGMARTGYFTKEEWEEFVKPYDLIVLNALKPGKCMLHTCGIAANPQWFTDYPIEMIHWAESATDNPPLKGSDSWLCGKIPMGGVDERLFGEGKESEIEQLARKSIQNMKGKPFILAPDCSVSQKTSHAEFMAMRNAVE